MKKTVFPGLILLVLSCLTLTAQTGWNLINTGLIEGFNTIHITNNQTMFIGTEQGNIYKSTDGGLTITVTTTPTADGVADLTFTSTTTAWAVGDDGLILKSTDTGNTWSTVSSGVSVNLESIFFADANTGYIAGRNGSILKTTNGGTSWTPLSSGTTNRLESVWFTSATHGFVAGRDGSMLETSDGGTTWSNINLGSDDNKDIYFMDADTGFVAGENGIFKTTDGGTNWTPITASALSEANAIHFGSPGNGYVVGESGEIGKSTDGGNTWIIDTIIPSLVFIELNDVFFINATTGAIVGDAGTLLVHIGQGGGTNFCNANYDVDTVNSGGGDLYVINNSAPLSGTLYTTSYFWDFGDGNSSSQQFPIHTYSNYGVYNVCLTTTSMDTASNLCVDTYCDSVGLDANGNLLKTASAGFTINVLDPATVGINEAVISGFEVFPNPADNVVNIKWPGNITQGEVQLYTPSGKLVKAKYLYNKEFLEVSDLPRGTYIIRLLAEGENLYSKLIVN